MTPAPRNPEVHGSAARILVSGARAVYVGPGLALAPHRNVAATIAIALGAPFDLRLGQRTTRKALALIPPGTRHHLQASSPMAFVYLDALGDDVGALTPPVLHAAEERMRGVGLPEAIVWPADRWASALGLPARQAVDARLAAAVRQIEARPQDFSRLSRAAELCGLSTSRFQHLFRQELGLPFRRYRLWRRMAVVLRTVAGGKSLTEAALEAGFSSSAHLSTTFRSMFGLTPSSLLATGVRLSFCSG